MPVPNQHGKNKKKKKSRLIRISRTEMSLSPHGSLLRIFFSLNIQNIQNMSTDTKPRRVLIGYDHTEVSNAAMEWIIHKRAVFADDEITLAIIVNDDAIAVEGTFGLESAVAGPAGWLADDYRERVSKVERESTVALNAVVEWFASKGVSMG